MRDDIYIEATPMTPERGGSGGFEGTIVQGGVWDFYPNPGRDGWED